ncbi:CDK inhibitor P21 binding protein isoform X2 [Tasmannia lanceolata]|uniref:CDK inhibitor P21 binding protein isoform X2 n=1 Tax=Tasmannia lanceolata TaxID=3420 RepID=UPI00406402AE
MPERKTKRSRFSKPQLLAFSSFARSIARFPSNGKIKRKSLRNPPSKSLGKTLIGHTSKKRTKQLESSDEEEQEGIIQADFAFFDPKPGDFHGVKILLQSYIDNKQWDLSGFVDLILGQTTVGTVVKIDDEEDDGLFSVVTAINLGRYKDLQCIWDLKEFLLGICREKDVTDGLKLLLGEQAQDVGLLVSQRVVNLPPQLLPPLYDALFDEVLWATEDEPTQELQDSFRFKFYLLVTKIYERKSDQRNGTSRSYNNDPVIYTKPEDEIFHKLSSWSFTFPLLTQQSATHEIIFGE